MSHVRLPAACALGNAFSHGMHLRLCVRVSHTSRLYRVWARYILYTVASKISTRPLKFEAGLRLCVTFKYIHQVSALTRETPRSRRVGLTELSPMTCLTSARRLVNVESHRSVALLSTLHTRRVSVYHREVQLPLPSHCVPINSARMAAIDCGCPCQRHLHLHAEAVADCSE